ncbi:MAG: dephospho-CoA kinase [Alphaproteobacteria bacterium]
MRLALTGSIGMGKSTVGRMFRQAGVPVFDADAAVHRLTARKGAAVGAVADAFPGVLAPDGSIDRLALGARVFAEEADLRRLERILHPMVRRAEQRFFRACARRRVAVALCDIPLLFETGAEARFDAVVVVSAPAFLQRQRVMRRPGMTAEKMDQILAQQWPDAAKRRAADFVITTGRNRRHARQGVARVLAAVRGVRGKAA